MRDLAIEFLNGEHSAGVGGFGKHCRRCLWGEELRQETVRKGLAVLIRGEGVWHWGKVGIVKWGKFEI